jgi:hypothetical protein
VAKLGPVTAWDTYDRNSFRLSGASCGERSLASHCHLFEMEGRNFQENIRGPFELKSTCDGLSI